MKRVHLAIPLIATIYLAPPASAQTYIEVEPNNGKSEATPIVGIVNGNTIGGLTLGADLTLGSTANTTADYYRVKTAALPLGIYKHRLEQPASIDFVTTLRGLDQIGAPGTGGGTVGVTDVTAQTATISSPLLYNQWFGFGKQEEVYWRIVGNANTGFNYTMTFATIPVTPTTIVPTFEAGPITISTVGLTVNDTELHVYDLNLNSIAGWSNDDEFPANSLQSTLTRTFPAGDYYIAVGRNSTGWNHPSPADDGYVNGVVQDFPNCILRSISNPTQNQTWDFTVNAGNGNHFQPNFVPGPAPYEITWWKLTVVVGAPIIGASNDNCAGAIDLGVGGTRVGSLQNATHDGSASCDPGGLASKDVWFKITNPSAVVRTLKADTCTSQGDTVLSAHTSPCVGATELACNDDCGGAPCTGTGASCITLPLNPGQTVLLRVSDKGISGSPLYTLHAAMLFDNDECATPINLAGPGTYAFDTSGASSGIEGQFETLCTFVGVTDIEKDLWYTYTATTNGTATITTCGLLTSPTFDTKIAIYPGVGCPVSGSSIACWDDDGAACAQSGLETTLSWPTTCGSVYTIQLGGYQPTFNLVGNFALSETGGSCSTPTTPFCLGDGTGTPCPCTPTPNNGAPGHGCASQAFPSGAILSTSGMASDETVSGPSGDTLVLTATNVPGPALFIQSNGLAGPFAFGDGQLCAAVNIIRLGVVFPTASTASYPGGLTPNEIHVAGFAAAGQTKYYQAWYRSVPGVCTAGQNYNLTQGLSLVWTN